MYDKGTTNDFAQMGWTTTNSTQVTGVRSLLMQPHRELCLFNAVENQVESSSHRSQSLFIVFIFDFRRNFVILKILCGGKNKMANLLCKSFIPGSVA